MRVRILRDTIAGGSYQEAGTEADLSRADAQMLIRMRKAEAIGPEPEPEEPPVETATVEPPENAMRKPPKRRKAKRGR